MIGKVSNALGDKEVYLIIDHMIFNVEIAIRIIMIIIIIIIIRTDREYMQIQVDSSSFFNDDDNNNNKLEIQNEQMKKRSASLPIEAVQKKVQLRAQSPIPSTGEEPNIRSTN